jgi:hypothetical protein
MSLVASIYFSANSNEPINPAIVSLCVIREYNLSTSFPAKNEPVPKFGRGKPDWNPESEKLWNI